MRNSGKFLQIKEVTLQKHRHPLPQILEFGIFISQFLDLFIYCTEAEAVTMTARRPKFTKLELNNLQNFL